MLPSVSFRKSITWLPDAASEPTDTIVLTGRSSCFIDTRFIKGTEELDWAFAGYRSTDGNLSRFKHYIDSRTMDPKCVIDEGENTVLDDGNVVEKGVMVNPETGLMTSYEEVWDDEDSDHCVFITRKGDDASCEEAWHGLVGEYQAALGRTSSGVFWAWQAKWEGKAWVVKHRTASSISLEPSGITFLPRNVNLLGWSDGDDIEYGAAKSRWRVLEISAF
ncbi:hypothetical protein ONZ45_g13472 [Pleurotus djamor]|nr:hypothetical protein ONZ45_g13472 [Pleurotus djamor]